MKKIYSLAILFLIMLAFPNHADAQDTPVTEGVTIIEKEKNNEFSATYNSSISQSDPQNSGNIRSATINAGASYQYTAGSDPSTIVNATDPVRGRLSVSLTGAATYAIPIAVPPGISETIPDISLAYSSQGGNGLAGLGWDVSGVSSISRIPSTKFHDNETDPIDFDSSDRFSLDGQRLILKSGIYGGNDAEYETENYANLKISSHGISIYGQNYGPAYFLVQYPDGSKAYYGLTGNSTSRMAWGITHWENPFGVRISYEYLLTGNNLSISKIKYGALGENLALNEIQFKYTPRLRQDQALFGSVSFSRTILLNEIRVLGNGLGYRNYQLQHGTTSLGYERLMSVTEISGDNSKRLNPTVFTYGDSGENIEFDGNRAKISVTNVRSDTSATVSGDFDGDGELDFILYPTEGDDAFKKYWIFNNIKGNSTNIGLRHDIGKFDEIFPVSWLGGSAAYGYKLMPQQAWAVVRSNTNTASVTFETFSLGITGPLYSQGTKQFDFPKIVFQNYSCTNPSNATVEKVVKKKYVCGDFNGDGISDILAVEMDLAYSSEAGCFAYNSTYHGGKTFLINLDRRLESSYVSVVGFVASTDNSKLIVADFNGDGKSDLFVFDNGICRVYSLAENNQFLMITSISSPNIDVAKPIIMGDYNGDGKTDFIMPTVNQSSIFVKYMSTGSSIVATEADLGIGGYQTPIVNQLEESQVQHIIANDFNNDGITDLIVTRCRFIPRGEVNYVNTNRFISVRYYHNKANGFESAMYATMQDAAGLNHFPIPIFLSFDKPNSNRQISFISNNNIYSAVSKKDHLTDSMLKEIKYGNGVKETVTYSPLVGCSNGLPYCESAFVPAQGIENYPNFDLKISPSFKVVSKIEVQSAGLSKKQDYKYYGAVSNVNGLGFLGFRGISKTGWYNGSSGPVITNVNKHDISKRGAITESFSVLGSFFGNIEDTAPSDYISRSVLSYESTLLPNKVFKIKNTSSESFNGLDGTSKENVLTYDDYYNPLTNLTKYKIGNVEQKSEIVTFTYENIISAGSYIIGRPIQKDTRSKYGSSIMTTEDLYAYNSSHLLVQSKRKGTGTDYITEDNVYDVFGNITMKTLTASGLAPRVTHYEYDPSGRFMTKKTDIEGLVTGYAYNTSTGQVEKETNPYGLETRFYYDVLFRKRKTLDYLGNRTMNLYENIDNSRVKVSSYSDDGRQTFAVIDDLGREIISGEMNINGKWRCINTVYDMYDREVQVSEPYLTDNPETATGTQFSTTNYDSYGRLSQTVAFTGKITNVSYSGQSSTVSDGVKTATSVKDAAGNTVSLTDNGGEVIYEYYANNNLKTSIYGTNTISTVQDGWGRKIQITDPSAGSYSYSYNDFGELLSETTPKGTTTYTLNDVGKIVEKKVVGDFTNTKTTYEYDPSTKLLVFSHYDDLIEGDYANYTYGYDDKKRLFFSDESRFLAYYQRATLFDSFGRPEKELYSAVINPQRRSDKWVRNTYKNGQHWQILDDATSQVLWQADLVNARGQLAAATFGNGISISNSYDDYGYLTQSKHDKAGISGGNVMTLNTAFEPQRGNLTSRYNSMFGWNESFAYDSQDRLISFTNEKGQQETQEYDTAGRIMRNNLGSYAYSMSKSYQNTSIDPNLSTTSYYTNREGIFNSGMEEMKGWTTYYYPENTIIYDSSKSHGGSYSIKLNNTTQTENMVFSEIYVPIDNSQATEYTYSAWVYSDGPEAEMFLYMKTAVDAQTFTFDGIRDHDTGYWKKVTKTFLVPADIKFLSIRLDNNGGNGNVWYDDVQIKKTQNGNIAQRQLNISYNAFKSPVQIEEMGVDKISYIYNPSQGRSSMFYGGLESDKMQRAYRKHYSMDGSMEIKHNTVTGEMEFITYIGGDAYTAPVILKSDGQSGQYLYLHRDYLGSIVAVTNQSADIVEKRLFDAWGNIVRVQDGQGNNLSALSVIDRGYTGHEHLQSIGIIHMNGRLYDAKLRRFLQPDNFVQEPYNTQNYNRYAYVLNNPLKFIDTNGENFGEWWSKNWKSVVVITAAVVVTVVVTVATAGTATPFMVGVYAGAAGGFTGSALGTALNGGSVGEVMVSGLIGAGTGAIFGGAGAYVAGFAPPGIINGALYGGSTSMALGGLSTLASGGDFNSVSDGMVMNFAFGFVGGGFAGYSSAKAQGSNIFTGKPITPKPSISEVIDESFKSAMKKYHADLGKPEELPFKVQVEPTTSGSSLFRHYTSERGYHAIMDSGELFPSIGAKNARYGSGQYFTDLVSSDYTSGQISRRLFGVPWNSSKLSYFIDVDLSGLHFVKNGPGNYLVPNTSNLPLNGRIIDHGKSIFKPKL